MPKTFKIASCNIIAKYVKSLQYLKMAGVFIKLCHRNDTIQNMQEYGFYLTRILQYKDKIVDFVVIRENAVSENPYSFIFYAVWSHSYFSQRLLQMIIFIWEMKVSMGPVIMFSC